MTKQELIEKVAKANGLTIKDTAIAVNGLIAEIKNAVKNGEDVAIAEFGTFKVKEVQERACFNFHTKERIAVPAHNVVKFVPAKNLKEAVL